MAPPCLGPLPRHRPCLTPGAQQEVTGELRGWWEWVWWVLVGLVGLGRSEWVWVGLVGLSGSEWLWWV